MSSSLFTLSHTHADLPVIALPGVDDRYPPQKKSFMMLHYMYEHFIDKFEWFLRADDDVFIKPDKLETFLRRVDSTKAQFIGKIDFYFLKFKILIFQIKNSIII